MIVYIQKIFRFVHFCGSFPIKTNENVFLKNKHLHMHSSTQISHADIIFDADSEFNVRFPRLWLFTFSRNKVWNQSLQDANTSTWIGLIYQPFKIFKFFLLEYETFIQSFYLTQHLSRNFPYLFFDIGEKFLVSQNFSIF